MREEAPAGHSFVPVPEFVQELLERRSQRLPLCPNSIDSRLNERIAALYAEHPAFDQNALIAARQLISELCNHNI